MRTPPKEGTISDLIAPGVPVYRAATPGSRPATGRSPTALSNAGKRMLQEAHTSSARPSASRGGAKPGTASSRRTARGSRLRTGSSRRYVRRIWSCACACVCSYPCAMRYSPPGSAAFTPQTRQDIAELKVGLASVWLPSATLANVYVLCTTAHAASAVTCAEAGRATSRTDSGSRGSVEEVCPSWQVGKQQLVLDYFLPLSAPSVRAVLVRYRSPSFRPL